LKNLLGVEIMPKEKTKETEVKEKKSSDKSEKITKEMGIMEIIDKKPQAAPIMMEYGMHCFGCMAARFESFEQGCIAHGITEDKINEMVERINKLK
jgi:hybrid cluster-associated redox disulfide protein